MVYAIISDIHANLEAFETVLKDIKKRPVDRTICLGDLVGYCASPKECLKLAKDLDVVLMGNHDYAVINTGIAEKFTFHARIAIEWTINHLSITEKQSLSTLPFTHQERNMTFVHATPMDPESWIYIMYLDDAIDAFAFFKTPLCFIGHTHYPVIYADNGNVIKDEKITFEKNVRYLINVGSVGQPRDTDSRACYVLYDTDQNTLEYVRLEYDIKSAQARMEKVSFPRFLINRLSEGR
jgi:predicted phosphodiesterase